VSSLRAIRKFLETRLGSQKFIAVDLECRISYQDQALAEYSLEPGEMIQQILDIGGRKVVVSLQNDEITFIQFTDRETQKIILQTASINPGLRKVIHCPDSQITVSFQPA
jgi:hypothetical protein